ncbi:Nif-specific regulatory protein [Vibrio hippocampi]|uniref:Nif-specific regulatory protein n=2 Tax=Vibrio hippocampi TaxID=654686 RepID=A0ABM8ZLK3_9VIBR|nr:Nif-specific regulatory protein [Vibrio hippocampi]
MSLSSEGLLQTLYKICTHLNQSLDYKKTLPEVLKILHDECALFGGMLSVLDREKNIMLVETVHAPSLDATANNKNISYKQGEGLIGTVMKHGGSIVLMNLGSDNRFVDKLAIYDYGKPFICVPLKSVNKQVIGVICAQPNTKLEQDIRQLHSFLEMIANLLTVNIQLGHNVAIKQKHIVNERDGLRRKLRKDYGVQSMVGHTEVMREIFDQVRLVSRWDSTILVRGESGTGKELIANAIHYNSPRANFPFVKLNCAALPDNLLESELFGHEKGAFTGAVKQKKGRFELAHGGTIFLDEIGETSPAFQTKLLRVLQEKTFDRVGGTEPITVDVRIIAATNRCLEEEVLAGNFREDIYYRLNVMPINLPPLRDRLEDIPQLASSILDKLSGIQSRKLSISDEAMSHLMSYHWPGNVRELENTIERAAVLSGEGMITEKLIRFNPTRDFAALQRSVQTPPPASYSPPSMPASMPTSMPAGSMPTGSMPTGSMPTSPLHGGERAANSGYGGINLEYDSNERSRVINALEQSGWVKAKAARILNMTPRQIAYRIKTMNIEMKQI